MLCYIARDGRLLVFRHFDLGCEEVGIQVPAGTVKPEESPERAAVREACEEAGLSSLRLIRKLGITEYDITPARSEIQRRHVFQLEVTGAVSECWESAGEHNDAAELVLFDSFRMPLNKTQLSSTEESELGRHPIERLIEPFAFHLTAETALADCYQNGRSHNW